MQNAKAKTITITSVKGGTGKTTTVLNIAGLLSTRKLRTIIVDLDLHSGVIAPSLNVQVENDFYDLTSDIANNRFNQIEDYITKYNDYIDLFAAPKDPRMAYKIDPKYINVVLSRLSFKYDVILIDTNHIIDGVNLITYDNSDQIIYLLSNDLMDFRNMKNMITIYEDMEKSNYKIVLNESLNQDEFSKFDIKTILNHSIDYTLPKSFHLRNLQKYVQNGELATLDKANAKEKGIEVLNHIIDDFLK